MSTCLLKRASVLHWVVAVFVAVLLAATTAIAGEMKFSSIVVFGDSLSDPGNDFALIQEQNTPPYDNPEYMDQLLIPHVPYAKGGHHYSNGATWIEQFARLRGLAQYVTPAWQSAGTKAANYAVGGGRARNDHIHTNLPDQVGRFLADVGGQAPSDALYVIEFGGNDTRDILVGGDPGTIINDAATSIAQNIYMLWLSGARNFLVWNVPDLSKSPAVISMNAQQAVYGLLYFYFNPSLDLALSQVSQLPGIEIKLFDSFGKVDDIVANPEAYGLDVVDKACVTPLAPPFDCQTPDEYLFWDGIHPTKTAHGIFALTVADVLSH
jgi:phospholipase/lecithinase/hemolysin